MFINSLCLSVCSCSNSHKYSPTAGKLIDVIGCDTFGIEDAVYSINGSFIEPFKIIPLHYMDYEKISFAVHFNHITLF